MANRHLSRSIVVQSLYEWDFYGCREEKLNEIVERNIKEFAPGIEDADFIWMLVKGILENLPKIDKIIEKAAPAWPLNQINIIDRNVLRIGIHELLFGNRDEVAINEAIELAKTVGGESSGKFINGVVGTIYKEIGEPGKEHKKEESGKEESKNEATKADE